MDFKKAKTIAKAFIEPLPEGQDWYEKRLSICNGCEYNSANIEKKDLTLSDKIQIKSGLCDDGNHCQACGCCVKRKCATKSENCGLVKLDKEPKWSALEVPSTINKGISIVNLSPDIGGVVAETTTFLYTFDNVEVNKLNFKFQVKSDRSKFKIKNYRPSCSCISVDEMERVDDKTYDFSVSISTTGFRKGWNERKLYITYFERGDLTKEIMITFKMNKLDGK
jgi:hypothetical protein